MHAAAEAADNMHLPLLKQLHVEVLHRRLQKEQQELDDILQASLQPLTPGLQELAAAVALHGSSGLQSLAAVLGCGPSGASARVSGGVSACTRLVARPPNLAASGVPVAYGPRAPAHADANVSVGRLTGSGSLSRSGGSGGAAPNGGGGGAGGFSAPAAHNARVPQLVGRAASQRACRNDLSFPPPRPQAACDLSWFDDNLLPFV